MQLLRGATEDVGLGVLKDSQLLHNITTRTNSQSRSNSNGAAEIPNHALSLGSLVNSSGNDDDDRASIGGLADEVGQSDMYGWDDVCCDAFLGRRCLSDDIRSSEKEGKCSLLNLVGRTDAIQRSLSTCRSVHMLVIDYSPILVDRAKQLWYQRKVLPLRYNRATIPPTIIANSLEKTSINLS